MFAGVFALSLYDYAQNFHQRRKLVFVAVFLGCTSTGRVGLCLLWFYVQELPKAQPAVVLVLKRLRRRDSGLKSHPTDWEKPGIKPPTPGLQDRGLSPTPRRLLTNGENPLSLILDSFHLLTVKYFAWSAL